MKMKAAKSVFRKYPQIQAVYLFGSRAEGTANQESDVDLAVITDSEKLQGKKLDILGKLAEAGLDDVDLFFPDEDSDIVMAYEAVRPNRIIYQSDGFDRGELYSRIVRKYLDFEPFLAVQREAYKRAILNGQA